MWQRLWVTPLVVDNGALEVSEVGCSLGVVVHVWPSSARTYNVGHSGLSAALMDETGAEKSLRVGSSSSILVQCI